MTEPDVPAAPRRRPQPRESAYRCALRSQLRGDPMIGTAFPAARVLLVEQPGAWGRAGLRESDFDPDLAAALERRAGEVGVRVLAMRRPGRTPRGARRHWALADSRDGRVALRWGTFDEDVEVTRLPLDGSAGEPDDGLLFLVCAHSKHDACCAIRGRGVAAALDAQRPGRTWECSHVGGERFAANVLLLPTGLMYGRVLPFAAPEFVRACEAGEVVGALLRGRIGLKPVAQAALAYCYEQLAVRDVAALRVLSASPVEAARSRVRLSTPHGIVEVTVRIDRVAADGLTCSAPGPSSYLRYQPERIVAVA